MDRSTMDELQRPLMELHDHLPGFCIICHRFHPLEKHHLVPRSAGELYIDGVKQRKPLVHLCGFGNNLRDPNGKLYHHGMYHHHMLHFRNHDGRLEYLITDEPTKYHLALEMEGWKRV